MWPRRLTRLWAGRAEHGDGRRVAGEEQRRCARDRGRAAGNARGRLKFPVGCQRTCCPAEGPLRRGASRRAVREGRGRRVRLSWRFFLLRAHGIEQGFEADLARGCGSSPCRHAEGLGDLVHPDVALDEEEHDGAFFEAGDGGLRGSAAGAVDGRRRIVVDGSFPAEGRCGGPLALAQGFADIISDAVGVGTDCRASSTAQPGMRRKTS
jgi:hypothetical protein